MMPDIDTISRIQTEKQAEIESAPEINDEIKVLAEGKRFTFDVINTPVDPLR